MRGKAVSRVKPRVTAEITVKEAIALMEKAGLPAVTPESVQRWCKEHGDGSWFVARKALAGGRPGGREWLIEQRSFSKWLKERGA